MMYVRPLPSCIFRFQAQVQLRLYEPSQPAAELPWGASVDNEHCGITESAEAKAQQRDLMIRVSRGLHLRLRQHETPTRFVVNEGSLSKPTLLT